MNIHPALLPSFDAKALDGKNVHKKVLEVGPKLTGCTVFYVDISVEEGPVILQDSVRVKEEELELFSTIPQEAIGMLEERVLTHEHRKYSEAIQLHAEKRIKVEGKRTVVDYTNWKWKERQKPFIEYQKRFWTDKPHALEEVLLSE